MKESKRNIRVNLVEVCPEGGLLETCNSLQEIWDKIMLGRKRTEYLCLNQVSAHFRLT